MREGTPSSVIISFAISARMCKLPPGMGISISASMNKLQNHKKIIRKENMSKFTNCLRNGHISLGDDFDTVAEVIHLLGGTAAKLPYHNWFKVPNHADTIACLLSEDGGGGWHNIPEYGPNSDACGWNEILTVFEYNDATTKAFI